MTQPEVPGAALGRLCTGPIRDSKPRQTPDGHPVEPQGLLRSLSEENSFERTSGAHCQSDRLGSQAVPFQSSRRSSRPNPYPTPINPKRASFRGFRLLVWVSKIRVLLSGASTIAPCFHNFLCDLLGHEFQPLDVLTSIQFGQRGWIDGPLDMRIRMLSACVCVCVCECVRASEPCIQGSSLGSPFTICDGRRAVDILEGTAQQRRFQFVVTWIGDAQPTYLRTLLLTSW